MRALLALHLASWGAERGDALLYAASALFAGFFAHFTSLAPYRQWGSLAIGPYAAAAVISALLAHRRAETVPRFGHEGVTERRFFTARVALAIGVLVGATLVPLSFEVAGRAEQGSGHIQPEGQVIQQAASRLTSGQHLYTLVERDGKVLVHDRGQPTFEAFFPYLPLMTVFGLPSSTKGPIQMTDVRLVFSVVTLLVAGAALLMVHADNRRKLRVLQVVTLLPTAALPLATGGDDMPVVALLLLAMVLAQRRRPGWSGLVLGVVSAMKFTAWPLAALALFAARDVEGRRRPGRMLVGMAAVLVPVITPFALQNVGAFVQNVVLFPLGLTGITSPAASNLPGHLLVRALPGLHSVVPAVLLLGGGAVLARRLWRRPPSTVAQVTALAGWVMTVAILGATATRVGYLLYPVNFFVWARLFAEAEREEVAAAEPLVVASAVPVSAGGLQNSSDSWTSSREKRVVSSPGDRSAAEEKLVGATLSAASQYQPSLPAR